MFGRDPGPLGLNENSYLHGPQYLPWPHVLKGPILVAGDQITALKPDKHGGEQGVILFHVQ